MTWCYSSESEAAAPGSLTTWSNMVRARAGGTEQEEKTERGRRRTREENNINNNMDTNRKSRWAHRQMSPGHLALDKSSRRATQP